MDFNVCINTLDSQNKNTQAHTHIYNKQNTKTTTKRQGLIPEKSTVPVFPVQINKYIYIYEK